MRTKTPLQADKMLDAAARLFATYRFHEVRMEDIAAEAGVGKGTLYRYFMDKDELYLALLTRASGQFLARVMEEAQRPGGVRQRLEGVAAAILRFFDENPHVLDLIQRAEVMQRPGVEFPWRPTRDELFQMVQRLLEEGRRHGEFTVRDPALSVLMLLGGLRSVIRFGSRPRDPDLPRQIISDLLHGAEVAGTGGGVVRHRTASAAGNGGA
jgi:TetR/AcrR family fatty acid metabolism transcriptional regulator